MTEYEAGSAEEEAYARGYVDGKDKAHNELRTGAWQTHEVFTCPCEPCVTFRVMIVLVDRKAARG